MSSIDGIGGPKGPQGPGPAKPVEGANEPAGPERSFAVDATGAADEAAAPEPVGDPTVTEAVERVAGELRAGRLRDVAEAFEAVVREIVEARYPDMVVQHRRQLARHLHEILADDPVLGARITAQLERAAAE